MDRADIRRSKRLALVLRHRPESVGIALDEQGWTDVCGLLEALASHGTAMSREELDRVVRTNDKQRFEWDVSADRIRARQGHTVEIQLGLVPVSPPEVLFHGTAQGNVKSVLATGLDRRGRHHVHLSGDVPTARRVGARHGSHVVLRVDAAGMARQGATFFVTENGVWLTDRVPARFIAPAD